jgi:hypothetical protein
MVVVILQYFPEEFVFGVVNCFDDVLIISGEIEKAATFAWRTKLRKNVLAGQ